MSHCARVSVRRKWIQRNFSKIHQPNRKKEVERQLVKPNEWSVRWTRLRVGLELLDVYKIKKFASWFELSASVCVCVCARPRESVAIEWINNCVCSACQPHEQYQQIPFLWGHRHNMEEYLLSMEHQAHMQFVWTSFFFSLLSRVFVCAWVCCVCEPHYIKHNVEYCCWIAGFYTIIIMRPDIKSLVRYLQSWLYEQTRWRRLLQHIGW